MIRRIALLGALLLCPAARAAEQIQIALAGKPKGPFAGYKIGAETYISAKDAAAAFGSPLYWYPMAGRVQLRVSGKPLEFFVNSSEASSGEKRFRLDAPVIVRASQALLPLSAFRSKEFEAWSGLDADYNSRTRYLALERRATVGPLRWFSYGEYSRIVLGLAPGVPYTASRKGGGVEVALADGLIDGAEQAEIDDGIVSRFSLKQDAKVARLSVALAAKDAAWKVREERNPRRLILEVYKGRIPPAAVLVEKAVQTRKSTATTSAAQAAASPAVPQATTPRGPSAKRRIVIDAGHGGKDPGASGRRGTLEKDINLLVAKELAQLLREEDVFEVLMIRTDDTFVPLGDRSRLANEFDADIFLSLHCNASPNRKEEGFEVYFLSEKASDPDAERLAEFENSVLALEGRDPDADEASQILLAMTKTEHINEASELSGLVARTLGKRVDLENRGVKQASFYVLRGTNAPAVLLELAFLTNAKDESKLESKRFRRKIVDGIYSGILDYAKRQAWLSNDQWTKLNGR